MGPNIPTEGCHLPSSWRRAQGFLPCFQGHSWLRCRGPCFSTALPILTPEDHRALQARMSLLNTQQHRVSSGKRADSSLRHRNPYKENLNFILEGPRFLPFQPRLLPGRKSEEKARCTHRWASVMVYIKQLFLWPSFDTITHGHSGRLRE